jgi:Uri superfamily endonuclease
MMKGIYVVLAELDEETSIQVGATRKYHLQKGYYLYVGSAMSSLESRIRRHLSSKKKCHWHIDYLLGRARIQNIIYAETEEREECHLANLLAQRLSAVEGFGCSDCRCRSHLFFCSEPQALESLAIATFKDLNLVPFSTTTTGSSRQTKD